jgi:hypothetical protein
MADKTVRADFSMFWAVAFHNLCPRLWLLALREAN